MTTAEAFAAAKINLTLHVTGQRDDGYHLLDSLVMFADVGDRVRVSDADRLTLTVTGPMAAGVPLDNSNLALRAAALAGVPGAAIELEKSLPTASGIGGGSADAAATLRALAMLRGGVISEDAVRLGADLPVCLLGETCRMFGIGERLEPMPHLPPLDAVLVNPGVAVPTPAVFAAVQRKENRAMDPLPLTPSRDALIDWLAFQRNDLQSAAVQLAPPIASAMAALDRSGARLTRMSGSGATCFGIYDSRADAERAARSILAKQPGWWVQPARLGGFSEPVS